MKYVDIEMLKTTRKMCFDSSRIQNVTLGPHFMKI